MKWMNEKQLSSQVRIDVRRDCSFLPRFPGAGLRCDCFAAVVVVVSAADSTRDAFAARCSSARGEYGASGPHDLLSCCAAGGENGYWDRTSPTCGRPLSS